MKVSAWLLVPGLVLSLVLIIFVPIAQPFAPWLNALCVTLGTVGAGAVVWGAGEPPRSPIVERRRPTAEEDRERRRRFWEEVARREWLDKAPYRKLLDENLKARGRKPVAWGDGPSVTRPGP